MADPVVTKHELLDHLAEVGDAGAHEVAVALGVPYAAAAMALLRLGRQGLATREFDPRRGTYVYWLTDHGHARLAFFQDEGPIHPRPTEASTSLRYPLPSKGDRMKRKKLHTGTYHCPACFVELDLVAEESLKCDQCGGPLARGGLDGIWADDEEGEE